MNQLVLDEIKTNFPFQTIISKMEFIYFGFNGLKKIRIFTKFEGNRRRERQHVRCTDRI